ncbi:hypothetical protein CN340_06810 [Bacillus anthracis]|nr:hypothetical protein CN340_06810 [Bacillus anthracis]
MKGVDVPLLFLLTIAMCFPVKLVFLINLIIFYNRKPFNITRIVLPIKARLVRAYNQWGMKNLPLIKVSLYLKNSVVNKQKHTKKEH